MEQSMSAGLTNTKPTKPPRPRMSQIAKIEERWGYLFILPWVLGFVIFTLGPMALSLYYSLTKYEFPITPKFIGLQNFIDAFTKDDLFPVALGNTVYYVIFTVPLGLAASLGLALLMDRKIAGRAILRTVYYIPSIVPVVVTAFLFGYLFQPQYGVINSALAQLGIQGPRWFGGSDSVKPTLVLMSLWGAGGATMIIFLAGLQNIPTELYEAADMDGAGRWHRFWNITIPMLSPTLFFNLITGIIGAFKVFTAAYVATGGGPNYASYFYVLHLFTVSFNYMNMGYGSALAWLLFLIILIFTFIQLRFARSWVYYESEVGGF